MLCEASGLHKQRYFEVELLGEEVGKFGARATPCAYAGEMGMGKTQVQTTLLKLMSRVVFFNQTKEEV